MSAEEPIVPAEKIALLYQLVAKYQLHMNLSFTAKGYYDTLHQRQRRDAHYVTLATEDISPEVRISIATRNHRTAEAAVDDALCTLARKLPREVLLDAYRTTPTDAR